MSGQDLVPTSATPHGEIEPADAINFAFHNNQLGEAARAALGQPAVLRAIEGTRATAYGAQRLEPGQYQNMFLCAQLLDDSFSVQSLLRIILAGHNGTVAKLRETKNNGIMFLTRGLNNPTPWHNFVPIDLMPVPPLMAYKLEGQTPLFQATIETLGLVLTQAAWLSTLGYRVSTATLLLTDGGNNVEGIEADSVATLVKDMESREVHEVWGLGVGTQFDFAAVFRKMGLRDEHILTAKGGVDLEHMLRKFAAQAHRLAIESGRRR